MAKKRNVGFTLIELLVVVSIIALLVSILLPALADARRQAKQAVDQNNQHQIGISLTLYSAENESWFPVVYAGRWLFDMSYATTNYIIATGGDRKIFYCPLDKYKNPDDDLFWYNTEVVNNGGIFPLPKDRPEVTKDQEKNFIRVTGYNWLLSAAPGYEALRPEKDVRGRPLYFYDTNNKTWVKKATQRYPAETELVLCITDSDTRDRDTAQYEFLRPTTGLGVFGIPDGTSHLNRDMQPRGGHILFIDGHVELRQFDDMEVRYTNFFNNVLPFHWW